MAYSGKFYPKNIEKYRGDRSKITYRSSWEKFLMEVLDKSPQVKQWSSEEVVIPYFSRADGKKRRYYMDFYVQYDDGTVFLLEVKPKHECYQPIAPSQQTVAAKKRFMNQIYTYSVNQDKWKAASEICEKKGWQFKIITEDALKKMGFKGLDR